MHVFPHSTIRPKTELSVFTSAFCRVSSALSELQQNNLNHQTAHQLLQQSVGDLPQTLECVGVSHHHQNDGKYFDVRRQAFRVPDAAPHVH